MQAGVERPAASVVAVTLDAQAPWPESRATLPPAPSQAMGSSSGSGREILARAYSGALNAGDDGLLGRCLDVVDALARAHGLGHERLFDQHDR